MRSTFVAIFLTVISLSVQARLYTIPDLANANSLIESEPEEAIAITEQYIEQVGTNTSSPSLKGVDSDYSPTSPLSIVHALHIQADALFRMEEHDVALSTLDKARKISLANDLVLAEAETYLLTAKVLWFGQRKLAGALENLALADDSIDNPQSGTVRNQQRTLYFRSALMRAQIHSETNNEQEAELCFSRAQSYLEFLSDNELRLNYYLALGSHYLNHNHQNLALDQLVTAYWLANEEVNQLKQAHANFLLAKLYKRRHIFDKALDHASEAGDYYEKHDLYKPLSETLNLIASIYEQQKRYNLALVHYFNAIDLEKLISRHSHSAQLRINIARVYMQLYNFVQSEQHLEDAYNIATLIEDEHLISQVYIMYGDLYLAQENSAKAIEAATAGIEKAIDNHNLLLQMEGEQVLTHAYQQTQNYKAAILAQRRYDELAQAVRDARDRNEMEMFEGRQRMLERSLKMEEMEARLLEQKLILFRNERIVFALLLIVFLCLLYARNRQHKYKRLSQEHLKLEEDLYTHPRSGLRNLRMLNARLPDSLRQTSDSFEMWHLGNLINEPLSDRLRFALFDIPMLRHVYLEQGYAQGQALERDLGEYLNREVGEPARLYHFSDGVFLYLEPNSNAETEPKALAEHIIGLINNYAHEHEHAPSVHVGLAEYPFLPRAYTAINAQELIDILLMTLNAASRAAKQSGLSEWVHIQAISAAPAASFANQTIREACLKGIKSGILKVQTSVPDKLNWE
uniref:GGDEF domain-containing protein n=1 Tax=Thaumasiovibrio occultus TaxID=1891184 RepID=UPI000B3604C2|nr:GGDEF domain-containing protein [Thaumasiovibrio occultus]